MGLGLLCGGVATARWLAEQGAILTVTDMRDEEYLINSIEKLKDLNINFVLGKHDEKDFLENDIIVINPDVPANNSFVELARKAGKQIENELTLFFKYAKYKTVVGITGTRGKTTTTNWIGFILKEARADVRVLGNDPEKPFLSEINNCTLDTVVVMEVPSFQLEIFGDSGFAPHVAVITNLYQVHLSRHKTMEEYALAKANIFKNQTKDDLLILDRKNAWTNFFLEQGPKSKVIFTSEVELSGFDKNKFTSKYGYHNLSNFLSAAIACMNLGVSAEDVIRFSQDLPEVKWREELIYKNENLKIYNDTAATSPEATVSALERFCNDGEKVVLIAGGTDRELDFRHWGEEVKKHLKKEDIILLSGSATEKMKKELGDWTFEERDTLEECLSYALTKNPNIILFSPGAKSFEKFKNEFDRGEKFNELVKKLLA